MIGRAVIAAALLLAGLPAAAQAHAVLERTMPRGGVDLREQPAEVAFFFSEPVEASFGAVRVFDSSGTEVQSGDVTRPGGDGNAVAVGLEPELPDGTYTATYRVLSVDSHPVSGGFVFSIGTPSSSAASVESLLDANSSGKVTSVGFWADRWLGYLAIALAVGGAIFLFAVWRRALVAVAGGDRTWLDADEAFAARAARLIGGAALVGLLASLAAIPLQGATAAGVSFWSALEPANLSDVIDTRFGTLMVIRALGWLLFGFILAAVMHRRRLPALGVARVGADGLTATRVPRGLLGLGAIALTAIAVTPALAGHASSQSPTAVLFPADVIHVLGMSVWVGGLALLVFALPAATGRLPTADRTRLLVATLSRFSTLALASVIALAVTGTVQAVIEVGRVGALFDTGFGRAVLIKIVLLGVLIGLGAANRQRFIPALRRLAEKGETPGRTGLAVRRNLRLEVALLAVVIGVAAALVTYPPPADTVPGPVSGRTELGPAVLEYTVDPARVGPNQIHLYLFDAADGSQYTGARDVSAELTDEAAAIGPLGVELRKSGPGHYVAQRAPFGTPGEWTVTVSVRSSKFDEDTARFEVEVR